MRLMEEYPLLVFLQVRRDTVLLDNSGSPSSSGWTRRRPHARARRRRTSLVALLPPSDSPPPDSILLQVLPVVRARSKEAVEGGAHWSLGPPYSRVSGHFGRRR
ncbi:hypothetical protein M419DRAFT_122741, partial [Trichoderma reesei RUT C-30]